MNWSIHEQYTVSVVEPWIRLELFEKITSLSITLENMNDCHLGRRVLELTSGLQELRVNSTGSIEPGLTMAEAFATTFSDWEARSSTIPKLALKRLQLVEIQCAGIGPLLTRVVDLARLDALELYYCEATRDFLYDLSLAGTELKRFEHDARSDPSNTLVQFLAH